jgi:hypothetical protein
MENDETRVHHLGDSTPWSAVAPSAGPDEIESGAMSAASPSRARRIGSAAALVVGGLIAGTIGITAVQAANGSNDTERPSAATASATGQTLPGETDETAPDQGQLQAAPPAGAFGDAPGGGLDGEQRLSGTVAAIGSSSITVTTSAGKSTYAVTGTTDIRRDGQPIALSALKVGETVLVHVYPSGSSYAAERILAGTPGFGRGGRDGGPGPAGTSTDSSRAT